MAVATRKPVIHIPAPLNPLEEAENILRTDGWTVGSMKCGDGKRCAVGALRAACGMRENTGRTRYRNKPYVLALRLLCAAIDKQYKTSGPMQPYIRSAAGTPYYLDDAPAFDSLTTVQQVDAMEGFVIAFNDGKTEDRKGRDMILRRFTKAAKAYAES